MEILTYSLNGTTMQSIKLYLIDQPYKALYYFIFIMDIIINIFLLRKKQITDTTIKK
jgi:hypothetical protein